MTMSMSAPVASTWHISPLPAQQCPNQRISKTFPSPNRVFWCPRRAARSPVAGGDRPAQSGVALRDRWSGGKDRPWRLALAPQHPLSRAQVIQGPSQLHRRLGRRHAAFCTKRSDTLHQSRRKRPSTWPPADPWSRRQLPDVVVPYGRDGLARIADTPDLFIEAIRAALCEPVIAMAAASRRVSLWQLVGRDMVPHFSSICAPPSIPGARHG